MYILKIFFFIPFILFNINEIIHESYTSIAEVNFSKEKSMIEISLELTAHDISYLFEKEKLGSLKPIIKDGNEYFNDELLKNYINKHFKIFSNNKLIPLVFLGNEINLDGELLVYMEAKMKKPLQSVEIINDLLITSFPNQQNIVNLKGTINSSYTFNKYENKHFFK